jgi:hypothetical protein
MRKLCRPLRVAGVVLVGGGLLGGALGGCQRTLWADSDPATEWTLKRYYGGDSARAATESRKRGEGMGFGFPMGMGQQ